MELAPLDKESWWFSLIGETAGLGTAMLESLI